MVDRDGLKGFSPTPSARFLFLTLEISAVSRLAVMVSLEDSLWLSGIYAGNCLVSFVQHLIGLWNSLPQEVVVTRTLTKEDWTFIWITESYRANIDNAKTESFDKKTSCFRAQASL